MSALEDAKKALLNREVLTHLLVLGLIEVFAGALIHHLFPDVAIKWIVLGVAAVTHLGLLVVLGGVVRRWLSSAHARRSDVL